MTSRTTPAQRIRVAAFLLVTLGALVTGVVLLSQSQNVFSRKATLHAFFENAGGLISGSEVRLAGVTIGMVKNIHFSRDPQDRRVAVDLSVRQSYLEWIRKDSSAEVSSKGLLGDSIVEITQGTPDQEPLKDGDAIDSKEPQGIAQILSGFEGTAKRVDGLVGDVDTDVRLLITPEVAADFGKLMHSAAAVADNIEHGHGLAHTLIYEPALSGDATQAVHELAQSSGEVHQLLADVRNGNGLLHNLVYEKDKEDLIHDLSDASRIVRKIAIETDQGKGTIGALLKDPSIYEDLTGILGNVKRNVILKALIRHTIAKDGLERPSGRVEVEGNPGDATGPVVGAVK